MLPHSFSLRLFPAFLAAAATNATAIRASDSTTTPAAAADIALGCSSASCSWFPWPLFVTIAVPGGRSRSLRRRIFDGGAGRHRRGPSSLPADPDPAFVVVGHNGGGAGRFLFFVLLPPASWYAPEPFFHTTTSIRSFARPPLRSATVVVVVLVVLVVAALGIITPSTQLLQHYDFYSLYRPSSWLD